MIIRIENIECRLTHGSYEIVNWYPNPHYGTEDQLEAEGYKKIDYGTGNYGYSRAHHTIDGSCFKHKESCCVIAFLYIDTEYHITEMKAVGPRLLQLSKEERDNFFEVYKYAHNKLSNSDNISSNLTTKL